MSWVITIQHNKYVTLTVVFCYNYKCHKSLLNSKIFKFSKKYVSKVKTHMLIYKRSPKGFKYGKQDVNFYRFTFRRRFAIFDINNIIAGEKDVNNVISRSNNKFNISDVRDEFFVLPHLVKQGLLFKLCNLKFSPGLVIARISMKTDIRLRIQ